MGVKVSVVFYSGFGHTKRLAESIGAGIDQEPGVTCSLIPVEELADPGPQRIFNGKWSDLSESTAIVFGSPTYMGSVSSNFKRFMEYSSGVWFTQGWKNKLAGGFINSGGMSGDKLNAMMDLIVFAGQHSMIWISHGVWPSALSGDGRDLNRIGSWLGTFSQSGNESPEVSPPGCDLETGSLYGARIANIALRWSAV